MTYCANTNRHFALPKPLGHAASFYVLGLLGVAFGCGSGTVSPVTSGNGGTTQGANWTQISSLPAAFGVNGALLTAGSDGYLYGENHLSTGAINVFRTPAASPGSWTDLTGTGLPLSNPGALGVTPNGTVLITTTTVPGNADVYAWNGSVSSPAWAKVTGWNGVSSSYIYNFANDSAGYTYFSPAWSGDIWRNDAPNSTNFTRVITNLYGITGGGASGHATYGGLYTLQIWNLGDGKGDMFWTCGEGELDNIGPSGAASSNTAYLTTAKGYSGNCTSIAASPTTILGLRTADSSLDTLSSISIATRAVTVHSSPATRTTTSFPNNIGTSQIGALHWMSGTNFVASAYAYNGSPVYLLLSQDDGNTWTDITATGAINSSCTGSNLAIGAAVTSHYIFARCQDGRVIWQYGPI